MKTENKRLANMELLRIVAMIMVVMLHYLGKGNLLPSMAPDMGANAYTAWILESLCIISVNLYVLISGYFLVESKFKAGKVVRLICQVLFYTVLVTIASLALGFVQIENMDLYNIMLNVVPYQMEHYWFMSAYLLMYLLSPLLAIGVKSVSKRQLQVIIIAFLFFMCFEKSILPVSYGLAENGYNETWFICLFLVAAYIRLYGLAWLKKPWRSLLLYVACAGMVFLESMTLHTIYLKTGRLDQILNVAYHYNNVFVFLASVGCFCFFLYGVQIKEGIFSKVICKIAPYTLGVYLLHEQVYVRHLWPTWFGVGKAENPITLVLLAVGTCLCVFFIGITVDYLRSLLFGLVEKIGRKVFYGRKGGNISQ